MDQKQSFAIEVKDVSMCFRMQKERIESMKEFVIRTVQRRVEHVEFWALKDVSFQVKKGQMFGLVGFNGSGKSTMLKIIAGILKPTSGEVIVRGSVAPLIELGSGFDKDLSAKENVFLNGSVLGYSTSFMGERYEEIIEFSELEKFQEVPLKNFSSGMRSRLAFSIATMVRPDVLIADEVLSVGDQRFRKKSFRRIEEMIEQGTTVLFVSHSLNQVRTYCQEAILLDKGEILKYGSAQEICDCYESMA